MKEKAFDFLINDILANLQKVLKMIGYVLILITFLCVTFVVYEKTIVGNCFNNFTFIFNVPILMTLVTVCYYFGCVIYEEIRIRKIKNEILKETQYADGILGQHALKFTNKDSAKKVYDELIGSMIFEIMVGKKIPPKRLAVFYRGLNTSGLKEVYDKDDLNIIKRGF